MAHILVKHEFIAAQFRSWGYETAIEEFSVLFPTPTTRVLEMVAPTRFQAALSEPPLGEDPTSAQTAEQLPTYNAYSIDGDVTAPLVYVNQGVPRDYEELARHGVEARGAMRTLRRWQQDHPHRMSRPAIGRQHALGQERRGPRGDRRPLGRVRCEIL